MGAHREGLGRARRPVTALIVLSAGAAKGVVGALAERGEASVGMRIEAGFDNAGAVREAFERRPDADLVILPAPMLDTLARSGRVVRESVVALGRVATGIAVRAGDRPPRVADAHALRESLSAATALFCPDTGQSTAGIHFLGVLRALGIEEACRAKLRPHPNGARAMAALAAEERDGALGCTQVTEILYTPGVTLAGTLPPPFELTTVYAIALGAAAPSPDAARAFAALITGAETARARRDAGFA
jgi:molybdate transport system substrate-binding protein